MPRDRLPELRRRAAAAGDKETGDEAAALSGDGQLNAVLLEAESAYGCGREIAAATSAVSALRADAAYSQDSALQQRAALALAGAAAAGARLHAALQRLHALTAGDTLAARVARLHAAAARAHAHAALTTHHALLQALRDQQQQIFKTQLTLLERPLSEEECERLLEGEETMLFVEDVAAASAAARLALRDAEQRQQQLLQIERALTDVRDSFLQLSLLVHTQQESIDTVEWLARDATQRVEQGQRELLQGSLRKRKHRKKRLWLALCVCGGAVVVLAVLLLT